jgi:hypothetical protein
VEIIAFDAGDELGVVGFGFNDVEVAGEKNRIFILALRLRSASAQRGELVA